MSISTELQRSCLFVEAGESDDSREMLLLKVAGNTLKTAEGALRHAQDMAKRGRTAEMRKTVKNVLSSVERTLDKLKTL